MILDYESTDIEKYASLVREVNCGQKKRACVITLGCQQNEADSEKIRSMLVQMGYDITDDEENIDLAVINTCAIREHAELKAYSIIGRFKANKTENPEFITAVVGCMAAEEKVAEKLKKSFRHVSFTLEPSMIYEFPKLLFRYIKDTKRSFVFNADEGNLLEGIAPDRRSDFKAWVSIMYGCNNFCSYCIVPYVRGRERSRRSADITKECRALIDAGYREITLLGQNVNSYKSDMDFPTLLSEIAKLEGDFILRFMTSHPKDVSDRLIEVMGKYQGKLTPFFHLPVQSGSNRVLSLMNRTYTKEKYLETVDKLRRAVPGIALSTDIIVGFPGESEEEFLETLDLLKTVKFDMVYAFIYSVREGTRAAGMDGHLPQNIKSDRMDRLLRLQNEISFELNLPYENKICRALVDGKKDGEENTYSAKTMSNKLVHFKSNEDLTGKFVNLKIVRAGVFSLVGELIE